MISPIAIALLFSVGPSCSLTTSLMRQISDAPVLALATGEIVSVPVSREPVFLSAGSDSLTEVTAYRFTVLGSARTEGALAVGGTFLVVPWGYDARCARYRWQGAWVATGAEVVFLSTAGRRTVGGELVLDVFGVNTPYPSMRGVKGRPRKEWLSPRDYFDLNMALPLMERFLPDLSRYRAEVERVYRDGNPLWSKLYPGREFLRNVQRIR